MKIALSLAVLFNLTALLVMLAGLFYKFKTPQTKALFGYCMVGSFIFLLLSLGVLTIAELILKHSFNYIYFICLISPFVIGKLVKFETLKKYTVIQIIFFTISLVTLVFNLY